MEQIPVTGLLTQNQVCEILRVGRTTVYRMSRDGKLKPYRLGNGLIRYREDDIQAYLAAMKPQTYSPNRPHAQKSDASYPERGHHG